MRVARSKSSTNFSGNLKNSEEENEITLDTEIDKVLEEKAAKSNLSVVNVKSVIRQVVQNQMVQRMVSATVKRKDRAERKKDRESSSPSRANESSDENDEEDLEYFEPKLTRAKTKELMETQTQPVLWPISPGKYIGGQQPPSETQILITQQDLPEESEPEDEEYVPKDSELQQSDEDSMSRSSFSDIGSPATPNRSNTYSIALRNRRKRSADDRTDLIFSQEDDASVFKTPSPRQRRGRKSDSAIGLRTRSKLPLNDTPLEALEKQLVPPDIPTDMYECNWNEADNEDYLDFLKGFMFSVEPTANTEANDDEEADPEYNVMEDEEDDHDQEEHRVDRAVKVSKKELNELVAELFDDCHFSSGDELDSISSSLGQRQEQRTETLASTQSAAPETSVPSLVGKSSHEVSNSKVNEAMSSNGMNVNINFSRKDDSNNKCTPLDASSSSPNALDISIPSDPPINLKPDEPYAAGKSDPEGFVFQTAKEPLFTETTYATLQHQLQQHIQLLAQSYILSAQVEDPVFVRAAQTSKSLLLSLECTSRDRGQNSVYSVKNLPGAIQLVTSWPPKFSSNSPIKKKILEAQDFNSLCRNKIDGITVYEREIVKLIGLNKTFMYGFLLPAQIQPNIKAVMYFTPSEDALVVSGLDTLKPFKHSLREEADLLSKTLVPVRSAEQIFHRIRNLKKKNYCKEGQNAIQDYFASGKLPVVPVHSYLPDMPLPPIEQPEYCITKPWIPLLRKILGAQRLRVKEQLASASLEALACCKEKIPTKKLRNKIKSYKEEDDEDMVVEIDLQSPETLRKKRSTRRRKRSEKLQSVTTTLPYMNDVISKVDSTHEVFPINCFNGDPQFYYTVPKYIPQGDTEDQVPAAATPVKDGEENSHEDNSIHQTTCAPLNEKCLTIGSSLAKPLVDNSTSKVTSVPSSNCDTFQISTASSSYSLQETQNARDCHSARTWTHERQEATPKKKRSAGQVLLSDTQPTADKFSDDDVEIDLANAHNSDDSDPHVVPTDEMNKADGECENRSEDLSKKMNDTTFPLRKTRSEFMQATKDAVTSSSNSTTGQSSTQNTNPSNSATTESGSSTHVLATAPGESGLGSGDDDDESDENGQRRGAGKSNQGSTLDCNDPSTENTETDEEVVSDGTQVESNATYRSPERSMDLMESSVTKKHKRSPGSGSLSKVGTPSGKRTSKYNTASDAKLLETCELEEEVKSTYAEAHFSRVQQRIEVDGKNPVLFSAYLQAFTDFKTNAITEDQFIARVEEVLKDYPDLVREFWGMFQPNQGASSEQFASHEEFQANIVFMGLLEKWTAKCPQLKTKILHKLKLLREESDLTEQKIVNAIQSFFALIPNQIMMDAFRALFPSVFRPRETLSASDFEEIDLDVDDGNPHAPVGDIEAMDNFEIVKLPEEKSIPATNTCPCTCHKDPKNVSFYTKTKHCRKCCLKFQDGRVFVHSGRMMKPVNVEFANAELANQIIEGTACVTCLKPTAMSTSSPATTLTDPVGCSKCVLKPAQENTIEAAPPPKKLKSSSASDALNTVEARHSTFSDDSLSRRPWTLNEDRTILVSCQNAPDLETGITELSNLFTDRSIDEIKARFEELYNIMEQESEGSSET